MKSLSVFQGNENNASHWDLAARLIISGNRDEDVNLNLPFHQFVPNLNVQGIYLTFTSSELKYEDISSGGPVTDSDGVATITSGLGVQYLFARTFPSRHFLGEVCYTILTGHNSFMSLSLLAANSVIGDHCNHRNRPLNEL